MDWNDERIESLRSLWSQGMTASQIAEKLGGISRNAVIGKAHRLGLSSRPSPIKREPGRPVTQLRPQIQPAPAPQPMPAILNGPAAQPTSPAQPSGTRAPIERAGPDRGVIDRAIASAPGSKSCMWPIGDPKQQDFHFCGAPAEPGRPYCTEHCSAAYHKRTEAA